MIADQSGPLEIVDPAPIVHRAEIAVDAVDAPEAAGADAADAGAAVGVVAVADVEATAVPGTKSFIWMI